MDYPIHHNVIARLTYVSSRYLYERPGGIQLQEMSTLSERRKDPVEISEAVGLPDRVGESAQTVLERLDDDGFQVPADARTYPAVVYFAAREAGEPVTAGEVAAAAGVEETAVAREFRRVVEALDRQPDHPEVEAFVNRYGRELDASDATVELARELLREGSEQNLYANRTPAVSASLCLYAASTLTNDGLTQVDFEEFGVSRTSIRKAYRPVVALRGEPETDGKLSAADGEERLREAVEEIHTTVGFPAVVEESALSLVEAVAGQEWTVGKSPEPIAAAVYWIAAEKNRMDLSQGAAADALGVHKVTVNRRVASVRDHTPA